jgi:hypothetical protein
MPPAQLANTCLGSRGHCCLLPAAWGLSLAVCCLRLSACGFLLAAFCLGFLLAAGSYPSSAVRLRLAALHWQSPPAAESRYS